MSFRMFMMNASEHKYEWSTVYFLTIYKKIIPCVGNLPKLTNS